MSVAAATRARLAARTGRSRQAVLGWAAAAGAALLALGLAINAGVAGPAAVPDTLRAGAAALLLFGLCGYPPARLLTPPQMQPHLPLIVLPLGAACSGLALTVLGSLHVPLNVSLAGVLALGAASSVLVRVRLGPVSPPPGALERAGSLHLRLLWPAYVTLLVTAIALLPIYRGGFATVVGQNPDGHLAAGVADFLRHAAPREVRPELPVDRMPFVWRSKYPIYYALAATSELSGLETYQAFATLSAVMLALTGVVMLLFAFHCLRAPPLAALLVLALVPLDRVAFHMALHPFYNQLWGLFALPPILLFGFLFLRRPSRSSAALAAIFLAVGAAAYPLMLGFPAVALGVAAWLAWRERQRAGERAGWLRTLRLPRNRRSLLVWVPLAAVLLPFVLFGGGAVIEKLTSAVSPLLPGGDLSAWRGGLRSYYPLGRFFGLPGPEAVGVLAALAMLAAAWVGVRPAAREARSGLVAMALAALAAALYLRFRDMGEYFQFKVLAFLGPLTVAAAVAGVGGLAVRRRLPALAVGTTAALTALVLVSTLQVRDEVDGTYPQLSHEMLELRGWSARLPRVASIRLDLRPDGVQLWAAYMLHDHPLSAPVPIRNTTFPHVPAGRKADYVLTRASGPLFDTRGPPLFRNRMFRLYRMRSGVPGPDRSSQRTIEDLGGNAAE